MFCVLFSLADLGNFIQGAGKTVSDTVNAIKFQTPYVGTYQGNQPQPAAVASAGGLLAGGTGTLLILGLIAWLIFRK